MLEDICARSNAKRIIEIGSWLGRSALEMASSAPAPTVLCVDTWLGSVEHWTDGTNQPYWSSDVLGIEAGEPTIFERFVQNIENSGLSDQISYIRGPSEGVLPHLRRQKAEFDLAFIDGDHSFGAVARDIRNVFSLLQQGPSSVLIGDVWGWTSVRLAALLSPAPNGFQLWAGGNHFLFLHVENKALQEAAVQMGLRKIRLRTISLVTAIWRLLFEILRERGRRSRVVRRVVRGARLTKDFLRLGPQRGSAPPVR